MALALYDLISNINKQIKNICCKVNALLDSGAGSYRVYTALLTQSGGGNPDTLTSGAVTKGVTYTISGTEVGDFTNVGAPSNQEGTSFVAINNDVPNDYGNGGLAFDLGAPVVTVLENTIGNIWFTYIGAGNYYVNSDALFTADKTYPLFGGFYNGENWICIYGNTNLIELVGSNDGSLVNAPIEIRVYN
jgi:hypothetical protein